VRAEDGEVAEVSSRCVRHDEVTNLQFTQDVPMWANKIYRERPMLTKVDGPVAQYRRWFRQFYSVDSRSPVD
jgi:3-Ketosteroid 9alpha-hydroxylase C-terminal domain